MFKKIFATLICFVALCSCSAFATENDIADARVFFGQLISAYNSYNQNISSYFTPDAKISRVVIKPDGTKQTVDIPTKRYFDELNKGRVGAKLTGYKNRFEDISVTQSGTDGTIYLVAKRYPGKDKKGLDASYTIVKTDKGFKVKSESWDTTVQSFLNKQ
ncbi:hypothetical protein tpqmel_0242 [Candidatus Gastranaerophilus sp. (ex Termes propinquus)]|nr:hypothetical protein tpqmel_0242 [Candidatus Gastranaerophilus sp. (ex Termes propinquus)]